MDLEDDSFHSTAAFQIGKHKREEIEYSECFDCSDVYKVVKRLKIESPNFDDSQIFFGNGCKKNAHKNSNFDENDFKSEEKTFNKELKVNNIKDKMPRGRPIYNNGIRVIPNSEPDIDYCSVNKTLKHLHDMRRNGK
mmetsp:Transcript_7570/g.11333  ORF Transcript_7570/g.11333 Transcript_7570/m.11333 type:complete len:137 (-) Transcript_7570:56-466(-)